MTTPRKYEIEASDMIHKVEQSIVDWAKELGFSPCVTINPETYYADDGRPSRYLTLYFGRGSEIRISVERQLNKKHAKWICYWAVFKSGRTETEGQFDATGISQIAPEITKKIVGRYEYALK